MKLSDLSCFKVAYTKEQADAVLAQLVEFTNRNMCDEEVQKLRALVHGNSAVMYDAVVDEFIFTNSISAWKNAVIYEEVDAEEFINAEPRMVWRIPDNTPPFTKIIVLRRGKAFATFLSHVDTTLQTKPVVTITGEYFEKAVLFKGNEHLLQELGCYYKLKLKTAATKK